MGEIDRKDQEEGACPKCGYCKACGRGGMMPYYVYPVYPYIDSSNPWRYEVGPYSTNTGGSSISTTSSVISWR